MNVRSFITGVDRSLDFCGYIPFVSTYTGVARTVYGVAIVVTSIVFQTLMAFADQLSYSLGHSPTNPVRHYKSVADIMTYGFAHTVRGGVEMITFVGNAALLIYDYLVDYYCHQHALLSFKSDIEWLNRPVFNQGIINGVFDTITGAYGWVRDAVSFKKQPNELGPKVDKAQTHMVVTHQHIDTIKIVESKPLPSGAVQH